MIWPRYSLRTMLLAMAVTVPLGWLVSYFGRVEHFYVDQITGSFKRTTSYWGWTVREQIEETALVGYLKDRGLSQPPQWIFDRSRSRNGAASGITPPISYLHNAWPDLIEAIPQDELLNYVRILQTGTYEEQFKMVYTIERRLGQYYEKKAKAGG